MSDTAPTAAPATPTPPPAAAPTGSDAGSPAQLPEDHPLVKTLAAQKDEIKALKDKARRLDEIEESQKTEAEKLADRVAKADAELGRVPAKVAEALKAHLVAVHEISDEDSELFLTASDPDVLLKQVGRLIARGNGPRTPKPDPNQGRSGTGPATTADQFAGAVGQLLN